ncbi:response regulator [Blautia sp. RD014234]|nr:response regulator [Blautia parvula]
MDKYTVLIADDEFWIRDSLKKMLEESKFDFYVPEPAKDGLEAVKRAEEEKPDIILTDINMPGINGIQLIQMLKEKSSDIEIIVISGYQDFEYVRDALVFGAIDYLLKPINLASLEAVLEKAAMNILHRDEDNQKRASGKRICCVILLICRIRNTV